MADNKRLPIDTAGLTFEASCEPRAIMEFGTTEQRRNREGLPLFECELYVRGLPRGTMIKVRVPGEPKGIQSGSTVRPIGLNVIAWESKNGSGASFEVDRLETTVRAKDAA